MHRKDVSEKSKNCSCNNRCMVRATDNVRNLHYLLIGRCKASKADLVVIAAVLLKILVVPRRLSSYRQACFHRAHASSMTSEVVATLNALISSIEGIVRYGTRVKKESSCETWIVATNSVGRAILCLVVFRP